MTRAPPPAFPRNPRGCIRTSLSFCLVAEATFQREVCADVHRTHTHPSLFLKPRQEHRLLSRHASWALPKQSLSTNRTIDSVPPGGSADLRPRAPRALGLGMSTSHCRAVIGTELFSGGPLSLQPPYPILYPFLCFSHPETATCKTELLRFPSSSAIAFHILS